MRKMLFPATVAALLALAGGAIAASQPIETGAVLGASADAIREALVEKGFEVRKVEVEDDKLEAYAVRDGRRYEIYVSAKTGAVTKVKADE